MPHGRIAWSKQPSMRPPDISVVISTFNRRASVVATLRSVLHQRVPADLAYEVIVVDNGSTDNSRVALEGLAQEDEYGGRLIYLHEPRQGVSYGRNTGVGAARAPIVAFTDDDNTVSPLWVARIKEWLDRYPQAAAVGGRILPEWSSREPAWLDHRHWSPLAILDYGDQPFFAGVDMPRCLLTANLAIRRAIFEQMGGFSVDFPRCQDHEFLLRLWRAGGQALYVPDLEVWARIDPRRLTKTYHRRWHGQHGFHAAAMKLQEVIDVNGRLLLEPVDGPRLLGAPGFVYADLLAECRQWLATTIRGHEAQAMHHGHRMRYFLAYILRRHREHLAARNNILGELRELVRFVAVHVRRRAAATSMSAPRLLFVNLLAAVLVLGSLYDIATGREHWPFSPYPMFATVDRGRTLTSLRLMGVTAEPTPREIPLLDAGLIQPFDQCRLTTAFSRIYSSVDARPRLREMLRDSLNRYAAMKKAGTPGDAPPLRAIRLYEMKWTLEPDARNVDRPDDRRLVAEVARSRSSP